MEGATAVERRSYATVAAADYADVQPGPIVVDLEHAGAIGRVVHLERRPGDGGLQAVAEVDADLEGEAPWYFSPAIRNMASSAVLTRLALTRSPATVCQTPVVVIAAELRHAAATRRWDDP